MYQLRLSVTAISSMLLALLISACQPIQPVTDSVSALSRGESIQVEPEPATEMAYLTFEGNHDPEWHLRATEAKIIGGYGKENWGNLAYSGQGVVAVDGDAEVQVNSEIDEGTMVATFTGTIRPTKDRVFTGVIKLEFDVLGGQDAPPWQEGGGADFIMIHGATGQEAPLVPAVTCYLCTWGKGKLFVDDQLVHEAMSHFMWTPIIRDENQVVWADEARTTIYTPMEPDKGIVARPTESQLHFVFFDPRVPDPDNYPAMSWFLKVNFDQVEDLSADPTTQAQTDSYQIAPEAGQWQTWVLASGDELRPAAPPDQAATRAEIAELKRLAEQRDAAAQDLVTYWDAGSPAYRWVQIATARHATLPPGPTHGRAMSILTVAMYDAMVAAWDAKYTYNRPRPSQFDGALTTLLAPPDSPSYPSEHAVAAGAASTVLAYLFPEEAEMYAAKAEEAAYSRLMAGVQYPSDVEAGLALGRAVAAKVIERAQNDGADAVWTGEIPDGPGLWTGENPFAPMAGTWQTWLLTSNDQLRPPPPPAFGTAEGDADLMAVQTYTRTFASNASAFFWQAHAGIKAYWFDAANRLILENRLDQNPPLASLIYAAVGVAMHDAFVACFDAKYAYWHIRPAQQDPDLITLFPSPNHPSYPAAHGCNSGAGSTVLAGFFPMERDALLAIGQEGGESRLWAGIHYPSDIKAGMDIGNAAGQMALEHVETMMQP